MDFLVPTIIGLHLFSVHVPASTNDHGQNYGLYVQSRTGLVVGGFKNSLQRPSFYIAQTWAWPIQENISANILIGGISGYDIRTTTWRYFDSHGKLVTQTEEYGKWNSKIGPLVSPSVLFFNTVRISVLPATHTAIHLSLEMRID